jgi:hypothetical protein
MGFIDFIEYLSLFRRDSLPILLVPIFGDFVQVVLFEFQRLQTVCIVLLSSLTKSRFGGDLLLFFLDFGQLLFERFVMVRGEEWRENNS